MKRLHELLPSRVEMIAEAPIRSEQHAENVLAYTMEKHIWSCPCGDRAEVYVASNNDAPGPAQPSFHDDEGRHTSQCRECDEEYDLVTLVPLLVWHVAQAGTFGLIDDDGNFTSADAFEAEARVEAEASAARGGSAVAQRYRAFTDPAKAVEAAARAMRRDPDDLIQIIPEALPAPGF